MSAGLSGRPAGVYGVDATVDSDDESFYSIPESAASYGRRDRSSGASLQRHLEDGTLGRAVTDGDVSLTQAIDFCFLKLTVPGASPEAQGAAARSMEALLTDEQLGLVMDWGRVVKGLRLIMERSKSPYLLRLALRLFLIAVFDLPGASLGSEGASDTALVLTCCLSHLANGAQRAAPAAAAADTAATATGADDSRSPPSPAPDEPERAAALAMAAEAATAFHLPATLSRLGADQLLQLTSHVSTLLLASSDQRRLQLQLQRAAGAEAPCPLLAALHSVLTHCTHPSNAAVTVAEVAAAAVGASCVGPLLAALERQQVQQAPTVATATDAAIARDGQNVDRGGVDGEACSAPAAASSVPAPSGHSSGGSSSGSGSNGCSINGTAAGVTVDQHRALFCLYAVISYSAGTAASAATANHQAVEAAALDVLLPLLSVEEEAQRTLWLLLWLAATASVPMGGNGGGISRGDGDGGIGDPAAAASGGSQGGGSGSSPRSVPARVVRQAIVTECCRSPRVWRNFLAAADGLLQEWPAVGPLGTGDRFVGGGCSGVGSSSGVGTEAGLALLLKVAEGVVVTEPAALAQLLQGPGAPAGAASGANGGNDGHIHALFAAALGALGVPIAPPSLPAAGGTAHVGAAADRNSSGHSSSRSSSATVAQAALQLLYTTLCNCQQPAQSASPAETTETRLHAEAGPAATAADEDAGAGGSGIYGGGSSTAGAASPASAAAVPFMSRSLGIALVGALARHAAAGADEQQQAGDAGLDQLALCCLHRLLAALGPQGAREAMDSLARPNTEQQEQQGRVLLDRLADVAAAHIRQQQSTATAAPGSVLDLLQLASCLLDSISRRRRGLGAVPHGDSFLSLAAAVLTWAAPASLLATLLAELVPRRSAASTPATRVARGGNAAGVTAAGAAGEGASSDGAVEGAGDGAAERAAEGAGEGAAEGTAEGAAASTAKRAAGLDEGAPAVEGAPAQAQAGRNGPAFAAPESPGLLALRVLHMAGINLVAALDKVCAGASAPTSSPAPAFTSPAPAATAGFNFAPAFPTVAGQHAMPVVTHAALVATTALSASVRQGLVERVVPLLRLAPSKGGTQALQLLLMLAAKATASQPPRTVGRHRSDADDGSGALRVIRRAVAAEASKAGALPLWQGALAAIEYLLAADELSRGFWNSWGDQEQRGQGMFRSHALILDLCTDLLRMAPNCGMMPALLVRSCAQVQQDRPARVLELALAVLGLGGRQEQQSEWGVGGQPAGSSAGGSTTGGVTSACSRAGVHNKDWPVAAVTAAAALVSQLAGRLSYFEHVRRLIPALVDSVTSSSAGGGGARGGLLECLAACLDHPEMRPADWPALSCMVPLCEAVTESLSTSEESSSTTTTVTAGSSASSGRVLALLHLACQLQAHPGILSMAAARRDQAAGARAAASPASPTPADPGGSAGAATRAPTSFRTGAAMHSAFTGVAGGNAITDCTWNAVLSVSAAALNKAMCMTATAANNGSSRPAVTPQTGSSSSNAAGEEGETGGPCLACEGACLMAACRILQAGKDAHGPKAVPPQLPSLMLRALSRLSASLQRAPQHLGTGRPAAGAATGWSAALDAALDAALEAAREAALEAGRMAPRLLELQREADWLEQVTHAGRAARARHTSSRLPEGAAAAAATGNGARCPTAGSVSPAAASYATGGSSSAALPSIGRTTPMPGGDATGVRDLQPEVCQLGSVAGGNYWSCFYRGGFVLSADASTSSADASTSSADASTSSADATRTDPLLRPVAPPPPGACSTLAASDKYGIVFYSNLDGVYGVSAFNFTFAVPRFGQFEYNTSTARDVMDHTPPRVHPADLCCWHLPLRGVTHVALSADESVLAVVCGAEAATTSCNVQFFTLAAMESPQSAKNMRHDSNGQFMKFPPSSAAALTPHWAPRVGGGCIRQFAWCKAKATAEDAPHQSPPATAAAPGLFLAVTDYNAVLLGRYGDAWSMSVVAAKGVLSADWCPGKEWPYPEHGSPAFAYSTGERLVLVKVVARGSGLGFEEMTSIGLHHPTEPSVSFESVRWLQPGSILLGGTPLSAQGTSMQPERECGRECSCLLVLHGWCPDATAAPASTELYADAPRTVVRAAAASRLSGPYLHAVLHPQQNTIVRAHRKAKEDHFRLLQYRPLSPANPYSVISPQVVEVRKDHPRHGGTFCLPNMANSSRENFVLGMALTTSVQNFADYSALLVATSDGALHVYGLGTSNECAYGPRPYELVQRLPTQPPVWAVVTVVVGGAGGGSSGWSSTPPWRAPATSPTFG